MEEALFLNGVFESVLTEIVTALEQNPDMICYLQPHSSKIIKKLEKSPPSPNDPMRIYISTSHQLNYVGYVADIVGWEDKRLISQERESFLNKHIQKYQPNEVKVYREINNQDCCINLILIKNLLKLSTLLPIENLIKITDGLPLKKRSRAGGWSYVYKLSSLCSYQQRG